MSTATTASDVKSTPVEDSKPKALVLNSSHRCDRCGAQAYVKVVMKETEFDLLFCKHHHNRYELALMPLTDNDKLVDESHRLDTGNRLIGSENS